jgi:cysteine-rich repeat protein
LTEVPWCGNDVLDFGEECDEGVNNGEVCIAPYDGACTYCNETCSSITLTDGYCGDGVRDVGYEECDGLDGVFLSGYECSEFCQPECFHDVAIRYTYSSSLGTGIAIKPELGIWMLDDPEELEKGQDYIVKYYLDNKIENSTNNIHVVLKIDNETLADYSTSINQFHYKNVNWDISNLSEGIHYLNLFVEKINEGDCNDEDNYASRQIIILPSSGPICGNGILELNETCDNGSNNGQICTAPYESSCDYCDNSCNLITLTDGYCGDGVKDEGYEECDGSDGVNSSQSCNSDCQLIDIPLCGNNILNFGEECDEGLNNEEVCIPVYEGSCSYCSESCDTVILYGPYCGDGVKDEPYEECDGLDGLCPVQICNEECRLIIIPYCGDGIVNQANESCDDGNLINGDGCSSICEEERECISNSDCDDGLFCNGEEICKNYECIHGMPPQVDDGLFCTEDICNESTDIISHNPININDDIGCTIDICNETLDRIVHITDDDYCNDGLFCNGEEICSSQTGCESGISVDCSEFNLIKIETCNNNPDSNPFTLDFSPAFTSICNERTDSCSIGLRNFTHTCNSNICGAECEYGETQSIQCGTNVGECEYGEIILECEETCEWESEVGKECVGGIEPQQEICDNLDNDCDGEIDENLVEEFGRISYSTVNTGDVLLINGYSDFSEERIDFFHGYIHQRDGNYLGFGSMHARGTTTNGTEIQLNVKFTAYELVEYTCDHITWRNSAKGTYWINGVGTVTVEYDYMDITYWFATGRIDSVGYGETSFEFKDMIDTRL